MIQPLQLQIFEVWFGLVDLWSGDMVLLMVCFTAAFAMPVAFHIPRRFGILFKSNQSWFNILLSIFHFLLYEWPEPICTNLTHYNFSLFYTLYIRLTRICTLSF